MFDAIRAMREASNVERCHTVPHFGSYTVGKHSYDAACLLFMLHPDPPLHLLWATLTHDLGERWVGDLPAPTKWGNGELAKLHQEAEQLALAEAHILFPILKEEDTCWLNAVDRIELWLWCHDQLHLGNQNVWPMKKRLDQYFEDTWDVMPGPCREFILHFEWERLPG